METAKTVRVCYYCNTKLSEEGEDIQILTDVTNLNDDKPWNGTHYIRYTRCPNCYENNVLFTWYDGMKGYNMIKIFKSLNK